MNSPIILLVIWFVINIIIKSAKDKQKIEEARKKRSQQLGNMPMQNSSKNLNKSRNIIEALREEIEKEVNRDKGVQRESQQRQKQQSPTQTVIREKMRKVDTPKSNGAESIVSEDITESIPLENLEREGKIAFIDMKKDLLKGIIMSEILSEPKSIKNIKRSM
jgi:hypothetical protein